MLQYFKQNLLRASWLLVFLLTSCSFGNGNVQQTDDPIHVRVQSKIAKGSKVALTIFFREKPDEEVLNFPQLAELKLRNANENIIEAISTPFTGGDDNEFKYAYYAAVEGSQLGKITFPALTTHHNGKTYSSSAFDIDIVDNIEIQPNDIQLRVTANKSSVKLGEPVTLEVNLYSVFEYTAIADGITTQSQVKGKDNTIKLEAVIDVEKLSGITGLEKIIENNFRVDDFDFNPFGFDDRMVLINQQRYFKQQLLKLTLIPTKIGQVKFDACNNFKVHLSQDDYFAERQLKKINICSKPLMIKITQ